MEIYVVLNYYGYTIAMGSYSISNQELAETLKLTIRKFNKMVRKNGGEVTKKPFKSEGETRSYFKTKVEAENFLDELIPYVVMHKLIQ
jgi:hypothetical protein